MILTVSTAQTTIMKIRHKFTAIQNTWLMTHGVILYVAPLVEFIATTGATGAPQMTSLVYAHMFMKTGMVKLLVTPIA